MPSFTVTRSGMGRIRNLPLAVSLSSHHPATLLLLSFHRDSPSPRKASEWFIARVFREDHPRMSACGPQTFRNLGPCPPIEATLSVNS